MQLIDNSKRADTQFFNSAPEWDSNRVYPDYKPEVQTATLSLYYKTMVFLDLLKICVTVRASFTIKLYSESIFVSSHVKNQGFFLPNISQADVNCGCLTWLLFLLFKERIFPETFWQFIESCKDVACQNGVSKDFKIHRRRLREQ